MDGTSPAGSFHASDQLPLSGDLVTRQPSTRQVALSPANRYGVAGDPSTHFQVRWSLSTNAHISTVQGVNDFVNPLNDHGLYASYMDDVERCIDAAIDAGQAALTNVTNMTSSQARAEAASRLAKGLRAISDEASGVLHEEAIRIYDSEGLSYGQIAKRLGISKTLAHQIIKARGFSLDPGSHSTSASPRG
jgi:hypothetical protein